MADERNPDVWRTWKLLGELEDAYLAIAAIQTALDLDLFAVLALGERTVEDLAWSASASPRGVRVLTDALASLGLLEKADGCLSLSEAGRAYLDPASPTFYGTTLQRVTLSRSAMGALGEAIVTGEAVARTEAGGELWAQDVASSLSNWPEELELAVAAWASLRVVSRPGASIVDLGCGSGVRSFALAQSVPRSTVVCVDWFEEVLAIAREVARLAGLAGRVQTRRADLREVEFPAGTVDVVHASSVLYFYGLADLRLLLQRIHDWLRPGGYFVSRHLLADDRRDRARPALLRAVQLFLFHPNAYVPTESDVRELLAATGFTDIRVIDGMYATARRSD